MNTQNITEYIRRGVGLRFTRRRIKLTALVCAPIILVVLYIGALEDGFMQGFGVFATVTYLLSAICAYILLRKNSADKYKLLASPCVYYDMMLMFSSLVLLFAKKFCISTVSVIFLIIPAFIVPPILMLVHSVMFRTSKNVYRRKISIVLIPVSAGITGIGAIGRLIFYFMYDEYKNELTQEQMGLLLLCGCLLVIYLLSTALLDIQRYFYFTRLEKAGLITEEHIK